MLVGSGVSMSARWSVTNPVPPCYSFTSDMVIHGNLLIHGYLVIHGNHSARLYRAPIIYGSICEVSFVVYASTVYDCSSMKSRQTNHNAVLAVSENFYIMFYIISFPGLEIDTGLRSRTLFHNFASTIQKLLCEFCPQRKASQKNNKIGCLKGSYHKKISIAQTSYFG